jgi:hypothetical protein
MNHRLAIFYHGLLVAPGIDSNHAFALLADQMAALVDSGLADAAEKVFMGVNGDEFDRLAVQSLAPKKAVVMAFPHGQSEIPTMDFMWGWAKENPGWYACYFHMKGVSRPGNAIWMRWRRCMENAVIWNWQTCVETLEGGFDSVGAHWLSHQKYPMIPPSQRYWGGNFYWSTTDFLRTLPRLAKDSVAARYEAEVFIGSGPRVPRVFDMAPHFPMTCKP